MMKNQFTNKLENFLIWLSASDPEVLKNDCPRWEKIKYEAFGASVLVPVFFGMIASSYAISTLTSNWFFIGMFALVWGFIILTIDRVLLSTYRAFVSKSKKMVQFCLRVGVAILMGLTVSHPLTLLLFKDTINSEIEKERAVEMLAAREKTENEKVAMETRIREASDELAKHQKKYQDVVNGDFLNSAPSEVAQAAPTRPAVDSRFADMDAQIEGYKDEREKVRRDLEGWQAIYDEEIRGIRSGKVGVGPNARNIERDHLVWRQEEIKRLNGVISELTERRTRLATEVTNQTLESSALVEARRREMEKQKMAVFSSQQGPLLEVIKGQIDAGTAELARLRADAAQLSTDTQDRVASLKDEKRADLMAQTNMLHKIFKSPDAGGRFALAVYVILVGLFTLIDTIPLVVKFFSVPGLYDKYLHYKEYSVQRLAVAVESNAPIDENFKNEMTKRDDILHNLLRYVPRTDEEAEEYKIARSQKLQLQLTSPILLEDANAESSQCTFGGLNASLNTSVESPGDDDDSFVVGCDENRVHAIEGMELGSVPVNCEARQIAKQVADKTEVVKNPISTVRWEFPAAAEIPVPLVATAPSPSFEASVENQHERRLPSSLTELSEIFGVALEAPERVLEVTPKMDLKKEHFDQVAARKLANFKDDIADVEMGFGDLILGRNTGSTNLPPRTDLTETMVSEPSIAPANLRNNLAALKAAGGLSLQSSTLK